jgi:hypothetical protein
LFAAHTNPLHKSHWRKSVTRKARNPPLRDSLRPSPVSGSAPPPPSLKPSREVAPPRSAAPRRHRRRPSHRERREGRARVRKRATGAGGRRRLQASGGDVVLFTVSPTTHQAHRWRALLLPSPARSNPASSSTVHPLFRYCFKLSLSNPFNVYAVSTNTPVK